MTCGDPQVPRAGPLVWNVMYVDFLRMNVLAGTSIIGFADDALVMCAAQDVRILELRINESLGRANRWLHSRGLKMALRKPRLCALRTGDPFSTRGSFSQSMRSSVKQTLSTWGCSWIVGLALANT